MFLPLMLGKLLLVALTVYTVRRFPLLLDLRVGAPYHSVSSILANEWQLIYNWVHISILGLSLRHFLGRPHILCILLFSLLHSLPVTMATCGSVGETQVAFSQILPRPLIGIVCITVLPLGRCWMSQSYCLRHSSQLANCCWRTSTQTIVFTVCCFWVVFVVYVAFKLLF